MKTASPIFKDAEQIANYFGNFHRGFHQANFIEELLKAINGLATSDSKPGCEWELIDDSYVTSCGEDYCLIGGSAPDENAYKYCPKCGGKLRLA